MPDDPEKKRKGTVKIGRLCGKLITDSRFYKPPKWKRKTSFWAIASAVRESAVCLHRSFATKKWVDGFLDRTDLQIDRGVTRLDGAQGKMQVRRPHFRTWGLPEANVLYWRMYVWQYGDFWRPAVFRRPGNCAPCPFVTSLLIRVAKLALLGPNFRNLVPNNTCWPQNFRLALFRDGLAPCKN